MNIGPMFDGVDWAHYRYDTSVDALVATTAGWAQAFYIALATHCKGDETDVGIECVMATDPFAFACLCCLREWASLRLQSRMSWEAIDRLFEDDAKRIVASGKFVPRVARQIMVNGRPEWIDLTPTQYLPAVRRVHESWRKEMWLRNHKDDAKKEGERV